MVEELGFELVAPIKTVHAKLKECDALALLADEQMATATQVLICACEWPWACAWIWACAWVCVYEQMATATQVVTPDPSCAHTCMIPTHMHDTHTHA